MIIIILKLLHPFNAVSSPHGYRPAASSVSLSASNCVEKHLALLFRAQWSWGSDFTLCILCNWSESWTKVWCGTFGRVWLSWIEMRRPLKTSSRDCLSLHFPVTPPKHMASLRQPIFTVPKCVTLPETRLKTVLIFYVLKPQDDSFVDKKKKIYKHLSFFVRRCHSV